ncbi:MAG: hypothetical protein Q8O76_01385 [Chloroflexota bacterium]|nr:hypothetical protein [Chloroflexota bacterium]
MKKEHQYLENLNRMQTHIQQAIDLGMDVVAEEPEMKEYLQGIQHLLVSAAEQQWALYKKISIVFHKEGD